MFQLSMHLRTLHQKNFSLNASKKSSSNKCKKYSCGLVFVAVFTNTVYYWCWKKYLKLYPRSESTTLFTIVLIIIPSLHHLIWWICRNKIWIIFVWVIKNISDCWFFFDKAHWHWSFQKNFFAVFCYCYLLFLTCWFYSFSNTILVFFSCIWTNVCFDFSGRLTLFSIPYVAVRRI